ncbi:hypothetical protein P168DRAFT_151676 [Aspergillus campestris IBT 28561]|uniref:Uncharacterized protein n=1 Tax=Aspergillus campestris (strain IBT 28561) TaxID=1392248 RepID=A0A2I1D2I3_ASPC2|nr:uncharacterized protein P168DRAFT_151676 [Aspergillus campestris IBT 28561]PKY04091.1 hypothetical protein P168DRAFT_151676 [Aspergillus campestris IBT 28561]
MCHSQEAGIGSILRSRGETKKTGGAITEVDQGPWTGGNPLPYIQAQKRRSLIRGPGGWYTGVEWIREELVKTIIETHPVGSADITTLTACLKSKEYGSVDMMCLPYLCPCFFILFQRSVPTIMSLCRRLLSYLDRSRIHSGERVDHPVGPSFLQTFEFEIVGLLKVGLVLSGPF